MSSVFDAYALYYDLLYANKDYVAEAAYVLDIAGRHLDHAKLEEPLRILELGCGTGGHAEFFLAAGCRVCGVDRSPEMIAKATERLGSNVEARFVAGDATTIRLGEKFDLVVALFHVLSYQATDDAIAAFFQTAVSHLKPSGVVVFDFWHGPGVLADPPVTRVRRQSNESLNVVRLAEPDASLSQHLVDVRYTLFFNVPGEKVWLREDELHRMRYFFLPELTDFQRAAGLEPLCYLPWMASEGEPGPDNWHAVLVGRMLSPILLPDP